MRTESGEEWLLRKKAKNQGVVTRRRRNVGPADKNNRCPLQHLGEARRKDRWERMVMV